MFEFKHNSVTMFVIIIVNLCSIMFSSACNNGAGPSSIVHIVQGLKTGWGWRGGKVFDSNP